MSGRSFATGLRSIDESAVLQTLFGATDAEFVLTNAMPIYTSMKQRALLTPEHEFVRMLVCKRGEGVMALRFEPRTGFAQWNDRLRSRGKLGIRCGSRCVNSVPLRPRAVAQSNKSNFGLRL